MKKILKKACGTIAGIAAAAAFILPSTGHYGIYILLGSLVVAVAFGAVCLFIEYSD